MSGRVQTSGTLLSLSQLCSSGCYLSARWLPLVCWCTFVNFTSSLNKNTCSSLQYVKLEGAITGCNISGKKELPPVKVNQEMTGVLTCLRDVSDIICCSTGVSYNYRSTTILLLHWFLSIVPFPTSVRALPKPASITVHFRKHTRPHRPVLVVI